MMTANYFPEDIHLLMGLLDPHFKKIPSLKEIVVNFKVCPEDVPSDDLMKEIQDHGWIVKITELTASAPLTCID